MQSHLILESFLQYHIFPIGLLCFTDTSCYFESCTQANTSKECPYKSTLLLASVILALSGVAQEDKQEEIQRPGTLRVRTTGGVTRKMQRQLNAKQAQGCMTFGTCFLGTKGKAKQYNTIDKVNQASVRVRVSIDGTNEALADANLQKASFTRFENNIDTQRFSG